jgi:hypothetical protein
MLENIPVVVLFKCPFEYTPPPNRIKQKPHVYMPGSLVVISKYYVGARLLGIYS